MAKITGYNRVVETIQENLMRPMSYFYALYNDGNEYNVGDEIIVTGANKEILKIKRILTVEEAQELMGNKSITAEVVCKVDRTAYKLREEQRKNAEKIKKTMDKMVKQMQENSKYDIYAAQNQELAALLEEYKKLTNGGN